MSGQVKRNAVLEKAYNRMTFVPVNKDGYLRCRECPKMGYKMVSTQTQHVWALFQKYIGFIKHVQLNFQLKPVR